MAQQPPEATDCAIAAPPRIIASFSDYPSMVEAMRQRAAERQIAIGSENAAHVAGLPVGYLGWLLGPRPRKRIGMFSLGPVLGILGVRLQMIEDAEALALYGPRLKRRHEASVRSGAVHVVKLTSRFLTKIGKKGGANSRKNLTPRQASELGRRAASARWAKRNRENGGSVGLQNGRTRGR